MPIILESINNDQNIELYCPLFLSFAQVDIYSPWATHKIAAPKPFTAAAIKMIVIMNLRFNKNDVDVGSYVLNAGSIKVET